MLLTIKLFSATWTFSYDAITLPSPTSCWYLSWTYKTVILKYLYIVLNNL